MFRFLRVRVIVMLALVGITAASGYAFAAGNTLQRSGAGDGSNTISGYSVTQLSYALNSSSPVNIDSVSFTLAPAAGAAAAGSARVKLVSTSSTWFSCTVVTPTWTCATPGVTVLTANELRIVAAQ